VFNFIHQIYGFIDYVTDSRQVFKLDSVKYKWSYDPPRPQSLYASELAEIVSEAHTLPDASFRLTNR